MKKMFDKKYKMMTVNRVKESSKSVAEVAREFGLSLIGSTVDEQVW